MKFSEVVEQVLDLLQRQGRELISQMRQIPTALQAAG